MDKINLASIRQSFGNSVYNWKVHEVSVELLSFYAKILKIFNIFLVSLGLILMAIQFFPEINVFQTHKPLISFISVMVALFQIIFLIILLSFGFEERMSVHKKTALNFRYVRDRYISLIADIMSEKLDEKELSARRDGLLSEFQVICNLAPQTNRKSYITARDRLKPIVKLGMLVRAKDFVFGIFVKKMIDEQDFTISDSEIDLFLPKLLWINKEHE